MFPTRVFGHFTILLAWLLAFPAFAIGDEGELPEAIATILRASPIQGARTGVIVSDLETGEVIFAKNADELLNPASNVKILTTAAALAKLGPDYRYPTEIFFGGSMEKGVLNGDLYLRGKGDPSLSTERLYKIVRQLRHLGLREVRGNIVADESFFDSQYDGPGWEQDDSDRPYMAGAGALSLNLNVVEIQVYPGDSVGEKARVVLEPASDYLVVENHITTVSRRSRARVQVSSEPDGKRQRIVVRGRMPFGREKVLTYRRISHPPLYTAQTFKALLQEQGIPVKGRVVTRATPESLKPVYTDWSEPLPLLVHRLNKWSQNHMAEMLLKTLGAELKGAPGTWSKGITVIEEFLAEEVGIPKGSLVLRNGSGLNDTNRASARQILKVLEWAWKDSLVAPEMLASLPIAGVDGTTRNRLVGTMGEGRVRAKTGTLQNVTALSGYATTPGGGAYAFAILVNDFPGRLSGVLPGVDAIGAAVASAGSIGGADAAVAMASLPSPDTSTSISQLRNRLSTYQRLAAVGEKEMTFLRSAWRTERDPALRAVLAEILYKADPTDPNGASAFLDSFSADPEVFGRLREALGTSNLPLLGTLFDLGAGGDPQAISHLLALLASIPRGDSLEDELAAGMAEVGKSAPDELLTVLEQQEDSAQLQAIRLIAKGIASAEEEPTPVGGTFANTLAHEGADARLTTFAESLETRLFSGAEGAEPDEAAAPASP